jgi:hypothetical protein
MGDFLPFMVRLFPWVFYPNVGNSIQECTSDSYSAGAGAHAVSSWRHKSLLGLVMKENGLERAADFNVLGKPVLPFYDHL